MRLILALYDPATVTPQGDYWAWRHPELPTALLEALFNNSAASREPTAPQGPEAAESGFVSVDATWCAWYRFYFGGDIRRKRYVLACALIRRSELQPSATLGPWETAPLTGLAEKAIRHCPLAPPNTLEVQWSPPPANPNSTLLGEWKRGGEWAYEGNDYAQQTLAACALLPQSQSFHCRISQRADSMRVALTIGNDPARAPIPPLPISLPHPAPEPQARVPQPRPVLPPRAPTPPVTAASARAIHPPRQRGNLRERTTFALLFLLLGLLGGYMIPKPSAPPPPVPPSLNSAPNLRFLKSLLNTADKLASLPGMKSPQKCRQKIKDIRTELSKPGLTANQIVIYSKYLADVFDELVRSGTDAPVTTVPAVKSPNATDR